MREDEVRQGFPMMMIYQNFMVWGHLTRPNGPSRAQGSALTRNEIQYMARRTCFKEQYYTSTRKYNTAREDCRQDPGETMYNFMTVFHKYLRIGQFVWARVLLCTRYYQSASVDCNGVIWKIHTREDEVSQGFVHDDDF